MSSDCSSRLQNLRAGVLGAHASVGLDLRTGLAVAMVGHLDGEAGEAALTEALLARLAVGPSCGEAVVGGVGPTLLQPEFQQVIKAGGHFLIRYCANTTFVPDPTTAQEGDDTDGRRVVQEWGWLGKAQTGGRQFVRRITKSLPHGKEISVVTDLWDEVRYPASAMLSAYRSRWGIETVFHQITDVFSLKHLIGTQPKAVLFQLSFCLLLYNTLQVGTHHLASYKGCGRRRFPTRSCSTT